METGENNKVGKKGQGVKSATTDWLLEHIQYDHYHMMKTHS